MEADALSTIVGQVGTLVADHHGNINASTGKLSGSTGEQIIKSIVSMLRDARQVLDQDKKESLERMIVNFTSFDYVVTLDSQHIYIVMRTKPMIPE